MYFGYEPPTVLYKLHKTHIFTEVQNAKVNIPPRSNIEAIDRSTVLCILYTVVIKSNAHLAHTHMRVHMRGTYM